ncbi:MAG TPA: hypothetical protein PKH21_08755 [Candidatus Cloacimonadota bacterium]|jgi:hypothetical protein|nr:hypothetical protein [Candidatus Cloacimonadota bacterium]HOX73174.1 hypothetical protein [Bacteroidales bacterium]
MKNYVIYLLIIIITTLGCSSNKTTLKEQKWKETEAKLKEVRCSRDRLIANDELKRGNVIAYFDDIEANLFTEYQYYLFKKYNIICRADDVHYFECQKSIMDSVIFMKYGRDFYSRIKSEITSFFNNRNDNYTPEGYYFTRGSSNYLGGLDSLYSYVDKMLPNVNECNIDTVFIRDAEVLLYVDTTGYIKDAVMKKRICKDMDEKIVKAFKSLPGRFDIRIIGNKKHPVIEEVYLKW